MSPLEEFCRFAARENIRVRWRSTLNQAGTRYRTTVNVEVAAYYAQHWRDVFKLDRPLDEAMDYIAAKLLDHYSQLLDQQRQKLAA